MRESEQATAAGTLDVLMAERDGRAVITVEGELDPATAPELKRTLLSAITDGSNDVVVHLGGVRFCDLSGLRILLRSASTLSRQHRRLVIVSPSPAVERLMDVTGTGHLLERADGAGAPAGTRRDGAARYGARQGATSRRPALLRKLQARRDVPSIDADAFAVIATVARLAVLTTDSMSVSVAGEAGLATVAATDQLARDLDSRQYRLAQGPCVRACLEGQAGLLSATAGAESWPQFRSAVDEHGVATIMSVPIRTDTATSGSLNFYSRQPEAFTCRDREVAEILAEEVAALLSHRSTADGPRLSERISRALDARVTVAVAQGILMERDGLLPSEAHDAIRHRSLACHRPVDRVATEVVLSTCCEADPAGGRGAGAS